MSSIPIRVRLTLPFALAMAGVLVAMGVFVYFRVSNALLSTIDQNLVAQASESEGHIHKGSTHLLDADAAAGPTIGQLISANGSVLLSSVARKSPILSHDDRARALAGHRVWSSAQVPGLKDRWRLLAEPVKLPTGPAVLVIGRSLEPREESLHRLAREFLISGPLALLLAIGAGYGLAAAALRPVEAMRRRAAAVTAATPGQRLPVPKSHDEISRLAVTLNDMLDRLEAAFEHERQFLADASHELRTPLALMRTELELALRRPRTHAELVAALRSASEETERMTQLAQDILLIARSDQEGIPIRREPVAATAILNRIAGRFGPRAAELGRAVSVGPSDDIVLDVDPARVEQAIGNLVDNALSHGRGDVSIFAHRSNGSIELHVADEGEGFPDGFADRAFARFSRGTEGRGPGGTGLGLAIVELIARAHGGSASVGNRPDGGADVWITLERREQPR
ncbi:MAG TPA: ATP-binding protein [Gaiellaceae bacterium]|nr:ATP-binding protein [Gaiellaceae bacterium]